MLQASRLLDGEDHRIADKHNRCHAVLRYVPIRIDRVRDRQGDAGRVAADEDACSANEAKPVHVMRFFGRTYLVSRVLCI